MATRKTRLDRLITLRNRHEKLMQGGQVPARDLAAVSREYRAVLNEIEELSSQQMKVGDPVDEIAARRSARRSGSAKGSSRAGRRSG